MRAGADDAAREEAERQPSRPAVFLDRDGTLVEEVPYLHDPGRVVLLGGVAALGRLTGAGYALVVVTNQAGVARGLYDEAAVAAVHRRLAELLAGAGVRLDAVLHCPHHPDGTVPGYAGACRCRKPGPGMLEAAAERLGLDLGASWLVGNHPADMGAALAADHGRPDPDGGTRISLHLTHRDLAGMVGASRENVSRALGAFRKRGFIDYDSDAIHLRNPDALRRLT